MSELNQRFRAIVDDGRLEVAKDDKNAMASLLRGFKDGTEVDLVIKKRKRIRSLNQNSYYWKYLQLIGEETGNDVDDMHELFKQEFVPTEKISMFGLEAKKYKTTTTLSPLEFSEYIKNIELRTSILAPDINKLDY